MKDDMDSKQIVEKISASIEEMKINNDKINASLEEVASKAGKDAQAAIKTAEETAKAQEVLASGIDELEQKLADSVIKGKAPVRSLGESIINSDEYKQFVAGNTNKMKVQANTITGQEGSPAENANTLVAADRLNGIVAGAFRTLKVRDVILSGRTNSNAIEFTKESAYTNAAAETAEGAAKPESTLTFSLVTENVRTIPTIIKVSKQILDDSVALASYIDARLRYGVDVRVDGQIVNGDGTGQNLSGMTKSGNYTAFTAVTGENQLDSLNRMIEAVNVAEYIPSAVLMNPADWYSIERLKVGTSDARYIVGDPNRIGMPVLWGLPVIVTNSVTSGNALVSAFAVTHQYFDRQDTTVEMFEQDSDNVQKNLLTVRAEARGVLATYIPAAVQYGALTL